MLIIRRMDCRCKNKNIFFFGKYCQNNIRVVLCRHKIKKDSLTENLLTRKEDSDVNKVVIRQITETIKKEGGMKTMIPAQFVDNISGLHER